MPEGYNIVRKDRTSHGGGVAILYKDIFKTHSLEIETSNWKFPHSLEIAFNFFQLNHNKSFIIGVVYRTGNIENDIYNLDLLFSQLISTTKNFYILGDFNINILTKPNEPMYRTVKKFISVINKHSLFQCVEEPTRENSLLDLIISNDTRVISEKIKVKDYLVSDHLLTTVYVPITKLKKQNDYKVVSYRDYKNIDINIMNNLLTLKCFTDDNETNPNVFLSNFIATIESVFNSLCPMKTIKLRKKDFNFPTSTATKAMYRDLKFHYKKWKSTRLPYHSDLYRTIKVELKLSKKNDAIDHFKQSIVQKGVWDTLKHTFNMSFKKNGTCNYNDVNANDLNEYFVNIPFPPNVQSHNTLHFSNTVYPTDGSLFHVDNVSNLDLIKAWKKIKKKHSSFIDDSGICKKMVNILMCFDNFRKGLLDFCNLSFKTGIIPDILKITRVVPIPKCENAHLNSHFRPISISPFLMTLLENIYFEKLMVFVKKDCFLSKHQFGSRQGHSTEHAMIALVDTLRKKIDDKKICVVVSLDLRNAFPSVYREKFLTKIKNKYSISDFWLRDYFHNRKQYVDINGSKSNLKDMFIGLIQGSVLGPPFFTYFINDIPEVLQYSIPQIYVDDTNLIFWSDVNDIDNLRYKIKCDLEKVNTWVETNNLVLNSDKTKCIVVSNRYRLNSVSNFSFLFNGAIIVGCKSLKCLGLTLDPTLSWDIHLDNIVKACYLRICTLYKIKDFIPDNCKIILGNALVMSLLNYMSPIWNSCTKKNLTLIEKVIRSLSRFVLNKRKYDSVAYEICHELEWLFPKEMSEFKMLCIFFKLINIEKIQFFSNYYVKNSYHHSHFTRTADHWHNFNPNSRYGYSTFHYNSICLWNNLPTTLKQETSYNVFRHKLKRYLIDMQKSRLLV